MSQRNDVMERFAIPWELRRGKWEADDARRAISSLVTWFRHAASTAAPETEDSILVAELVRRLAALEPDAHAELADLLHSVELQRFPDAHASVLAALAGPEETRLEGVDGDPVERLAALLDSMSTRERTADRDPAPEFFAAIKALAAIGTTRALQILLSTYAAGDAAPLNESFNEAIIEAVASLGSRAVEPATALWPHLSQRERMLVGDAIASKPVNDRAWPLLASWLDEAQGEDLHRVLGDIACYAAPCGGGDFEELLREAEPHIARAEQLFRRRLERAGPSGDGVTIAALEAGLDQLAECRAPPLTQAELKAQSIERQIRDAREGDLSYRTYMAGIKSLVLDVQQVLAIDPSEAVRRLLADTTNERAVQAILADDPSVSIRCTLAKRDGLDPALLTKLAADPDATVRRTVAYHVPEEIQRRVLLRDQDALVRAAVVRALPLQDLGDVARDPAPEVRGRVADHPEVTLPLLRELANDPDPGVRQSVAQSSRVPRSLLRQLSNDDDSYVVRIATSMLERGWHDQRLCECCGGSHD